MTPRFPPGFSHPVAVGTGGFGAVYRARQDALNRLVALKFITEKNGAARAKLIEEASLQAQLRIQGIPQVFDVKDVAGTVCIVMEWIKGCSLREFIGKDIPSAWTMAIITEIIGIIAALHEKECVHRDIKPENIIISAQGVFFIDFGFSLAIDQGTRQSTAGTVKGTPEYIAPELWGGNSTSADLKRADLYSMGKVIGELLGERPLPECIALCLNASPEKRPETAADVLHLWKTEVRPSPFYWPESAANWTNIIIARQLYGAVQSLLQQKRNEEGYALLLECLNTYPELPGAVELMGRFPVINKNQRDRARYRLGGIVLLLFVTVCSLLFAGLKLTRPDTHVAVNNQQFDRSLFMSSAHDHQPAIDRSLPFKNITSQFTAIAGNLEVVSHPAAGTLLIDGRHYTDSVHTITLSTHTTGHRIVWKSLSGTVLWKERITTLPFETKRICIKER